MGRAPKRSRGPGFRDLTDRASTGTFTAQVGERLRAARVARGFTQDELAARLRLDGIEIWRSGVAAVESGAREFPLSELFAVCNVLGITIYDLVKDGKSRDLLALTDVVRASATDLVPVLWPHDGAGPDTWCFYSDRAAVEARLRDIVADLPAGSLAKTWAVTPEEAQVALSEINHEAVTKGAKLLERQPAEVALASVIVWGRGFVAERDARLQGRPDFEELSPRSRQAVRGRITRELVDELADRMAKLDEGAR